MGHFYYSFAVSMMHSMWQAAIWLAAYFLIVHSLKNCAPLFKRNLLFVVISVQLITTCITFLVYYSATFGTIQNNIAGFLAAGIPGNDWLRNSSVWIFYIYTTIVGFKSIGALYNWFYFKNNLSSSFIKPPAETRIFTSLKADHFGIKRKVAIWYSNAVNTPVTFGFLKPVILLPVALINQLSIEETESLIVHELTHIRNNDFLLNWVLVITEMIYFFNPFIRIIAARIRLEREKSCDVQVLHYNYGSVEYAAALLKTARLRQHIASFQLAAVSNNKELLRRIRFFSKEKNVYPQKNTPAPLAFVSVLIIFIVTIGLLLQITKKAAPVQAVARISNKIAEPSAIGGTDKDNPSSANLSFSLPEIVIKAVNATAPFPEKNIKLEKVVISVEKNAEISGNNFTPTPVSYTSAQDFDEQVKEVIINEESSTGKTVTKVYRVKLKNGEWTAEPLWMTAETQPGKDSLKLKIADSVYRLIPPVQ